jgi:hypothetical protein
MGRKAEFHHWKNPKHSNGLSASIECAFPELMGDFASESFD